MREPQVSVILPSYNHANFVGTAINSVLSQTLKNIEIIVVDDGSTDGSENKIAAIKDPRIIFIPIKENRRHHPRNLALSHARGRYIAFQNSDDEWMPSKLEEQIVVMEKDNKLAACFTAVELMGENGLPYKGTWMKGAFEQNNKDRHQWLRHFYISGNCLCISSAMVRASTLAQTGPFCQSQFYLSDFDLWVRLAAQGEFDVIPKKLTKMRIFNNRNLSRPSPETNSINDLEQIKTLSRYAEPPLLEQLPRIFEIEMRGATSLASRYVILAKIARLAGSPSHRFISDMLLSHVLEDENLRKDALSSHGTGLIKEFLAERSKINIRNERKWLI